MTGWRHVTSRMLQALKLSLCDGCCERGRALSWGEALISLDNSLANSSRALSSSPPVSPSHVPSSRVRSCLVVSRRVHSCPVGFGRVQSCPVGSSRLRPRCLLLVVDNSDDVMRARHGTGNEIDPAGHVVGPVTSWPVWRVRYYDVTITFMTHAV